MRTLGGGAPPGAKGGAGDAFWNSAVASEVPTPKSVMKGQQQTLQLYP